MKGFLFLFLPLNKRVVGPSLSQTPKTDEATPKLTRAAVQRNPSSATFHGWKDVDLIVRSNEIEVDEDDLNEGFCHYSIINDDE